MASQLHVMVLRTFSRNSSNWGWCLNYVPYDLEDELMTLAPLSSACNPTLMKLEFPKFIDENSLDFFLFIYDHQTLENRGCISLPLTWKLMPHLGLNSLTLQVKTLGQLPRFFIKWFKEESHHEFWLATLLEAITLASVCANKLALLKPELLFYFGIFFSLLMVPLHISLLILLSTHTQPLPISVNHFEICYAQVFQPSHCCKIT